jgi:hypothetical protein
LCVFAAETHLLQLQRLKKNYPHHWLFSLGRVGSRYACGFPHSLRLDYITKLCRKQEKAIQNHEIGNVPNTGQGEARNRKYKRLELGGGHVYGRSSI